MPETKKPSILYVDDEPDNLSSFKAEFRRYYNVYTALSGKEGIDILCKNEIQLIVTDQRMPEMTGVQFLEAIIPEYPDAVRMILTGFTDIEAIIKAINTGRVFRYITKPWDPTEMKMILDTALKLYQLEKQNRQLVTKLQDEVLEQKRILNLFEKYVPANIVREALQNEENTILSGESRIISVLFCDIRHFTRTTKNLDSKVVLKFLNDYFKMVTTCVKNNKGSVNKFLGDGVLILFGAPISYIDNQLNAVRCGLDILESIQALNESYKDKLVGETTLGIGINTGEATVGNVGSSERMEYTAVGSTINFAFKLEKLTHDKPNSMVISESTYSVVKEFVEAEKIEQQLPDLEEKIVAYRVNALKK